MGIKPMIDARSLAIATVQAVFDAASDLEDAQASRGLDTTREREVLFYAKGLIDKLKKGEEIEENE